MKTLLLLALVFLVATADGAEPPSIARTNFGSVDGQPVFLYTLKNHNGTEVAITNYGATIVSLKTPDRTGRFADIVLGFDDLAGYRGKNPYFGATVGRYANRIAKGRFTLAGKEYRAPVNNGPNALHGGLRGFDKRVWEAKPRTDSHGAHLTCTYLSKDGEEGYPGNLKVTVEFTLTDANELRIEYSAATDRETVLNLTNHSYFNLAGQGSGEVLNHRVMLAAEQFTPVDDTLIPTGELRNVAGTAFDFRQPTAIGARIDQPDPQLKAGGGYDHNFVVAGGQQPTLFARVTEPGSGRVLEALTTEPGVQFYTGNHLDGSVHGKGGKPYGPRAGFTLETQHFPDSPNHPNFPITVLKPGERFHSVTIFRFAAE